MKIFTPWLLFLLVLSASHPVNACSGLGAIPVQHHGRIKAFSAFAQETLQSISGKDRWHGQSAVDFILFNSEHPAIFLELPLIRIDHPVLKSRLGLPSGENNFSYLKIQPALSVLKVLVQSAAAKREKDERPSALEQQAEILYQRFITVEHLSTGERITVIPAKVAWVSPYKTAGPQAETFKKLVRESVINPRGSSSAVKLWSAQVAASLEPGQGTRIQLEAFYYLLRPFYYAWILYLAGFVLLLLTRPLFRSLGKYLILAGFVLHTGGLLLRWLILLRPPVANMYETMIFMDWGLMLTVGIFVVIQKRAVFLSSGALVSALVMLYARLLPVDQSLDVLAPVLRSSYWLTVHVITIISSYSLFAFAMAVAHRHLFLSVRAKMSPQEDQLSADTIYRLLQAGLIALGAGTILGGVWANEAWGRFWGWDPKETWAFITFLGYMAILHLRYSKKLSNFALAVGGILGFLLVIMTWYGVNFVLGRGMHSYGAGSGGLQWIVYFLVFEVGFLSYVGFKRRSA
ncbi:MAG: cytochrome c biogenesis protein CcsA [Candidatus Omnitrophica bacterium]|nr:cytochrome c biogenesis protein CcsA [Candidatus Omnitrophota bacterium]